MRGMRGNRGMPPAMIAGALLALAGVLTGPGSKADAQSQSRQKAAPQEFHIEVNTLPGCFFSGCTQAVSAANIRVTAGNVRVPVRVAQPPGGAVWGAGAVPVHLLVVFAPGIARPADADLLAKLKQVLTAGWLVSLCRADGSFTPYAQEADLKGELASPAKAATADAGLDGIGSAIEELRVQPGYRVLLADLGGGSDDRFVRWLVNSADRLSPIYVSDGGRVEMPGSSSSGVGFGGGSSAFGRKANETERAYTDGVFHELTLAEALRDVLGDRRFEYDLRFLAPAGAAAGAPVKLTFLDPGTHLPYEIRTDLYSVETRDVGGKPTRVRDDATSRLKTVER